MRSCGGAEGRPKGAAKVLHFQRKCNISVFGSPDQREIGANRGEKCYKKMFQWGCYTFGQKSGEMEASREPVFELILAGKSEGKRDGSGTVLYNFCTGFVEVMGGRTKQDWKGLAHA